MCVDWFDDFEPPRNLERARVPVEISSTADGEVLLAGWEPAGGSGPQPTRLAVVANLPDGCDPGSHAYDEPVRTARPNRDEIEDLLEAPILYLHGTKAWDFGEEEIKRLREYRDRGGLLLAVCPKEAREFRASMEKLALDVFPGYKLRRLAARDPLFSGQLQFAIEDPPEVLEIHNGVRPLMLLVGEDIAAAWNRYDLKKGESGFQLGCNLYLYATDKTSIPSRLVTNTIPIEPVSYRKFTSRFKASPRIASIEPGVSALIISGSVCTDPSRSAKNSSSVFGPPRSARSRSRPVAAAIVGIDRKNENSSAIA